MNQLTFDPERMDAAAKRLRAVEAKVTSVARAFGAIELDKVQSPAVKGYLEPTIRRTMNMAHGDAREIRDGAQRVTTTAARARRADAGSGRPSKSRRKRDGKMGGKAKAGAFPKNLKYPGVKASRQEMACWLASRAQKMGAPPELLVTAALVESNLQNVNHGHASSSGLFQIQAGIHPAPPGFGSASGELQSKQWWTNHPDAQLAWFANAVKGTDGGGRGPNTTGAAAVGGWAADIEKPAEQYRGRYQQRYGEAQRMVDKCRVSGNGTGGARAPGGGAAAGLGARITKSAHGMIGIENRPKQFAHMQSVAGSGGRAPWCGTFVYTALRKAGKKPGGSGYAAVSTWVANAKAKKGGMKVVSASEARPGDLVAYDWDANGNFAEGNEHIGILDSEVKDGKFKTVEGNTNGGTSAVRSREMGSGPKIIFIRVGGG